MDQKEAKCKVCEDHQFQHITYIVTYMFMPINFFWQTITQTNENHYRAGKNTCKVSNKITRKTCSHSKGFLKIAVPKKLAKSVKNTCEKGHFW